MATEKESFVPALGADWLTPYYDFLSGLVSEARFKRRLVELARIASGHDVLDMGCGTGTLVLLAKEMHPGARVTGVDVDPKILGIARAKVEKAAADVKLEQGSATSLPFPDASFDRVLTSLMLHHLTTPQKRAAFREVGRVLRPGGELHIADWGKPHNFLMQVASLGFRYFDGGETTEANLKGELPALVAEAGLTDVVESERQGTLFGTLAFVSGRRLAVG